MRFTRDHSRRSGCAAFVRHVDQIHAGGLLEQLRPEVRGRTAAGRGVIQLAGPRFRVRNEFLQRTRRGRVTHDDVLRGRDEAHRCEIPDGVVGNALDRGIEREIAIETEQHRMPVRCRACCNFGGDHASAAGTVVDDHLLSERFGELLRKDARQCIARAARRIGHEEADRLRGVAAVLAAAWTPVASDSTHSAALAAVTRNSRLCVVRCAR